MSDFQSQLAHALRGRYTIERELGRGGMSIVYLAHDEDQGRQVALKVLRPELAATVGPERFLSEIKMAAGFVHPHILPLHNWGNAAGMLYYTMPYVAGESLRDRLAREGRLDLGAAVQIVAEVASALDYAHSQQIVHRDIKPENILIVAGHAVVSDFGIARALSEGRRTGTGIVIGSPDYMSPEQAEGAEAVDHRTDVYSLGCVLFEMLCGRVPRSVTLSTAISGERVAGRSRSVTRAHASLPMAVEAVVVQALAVRPQDRYASAGALAAALDDAARAGGWSRNKRRVAAAAAFSVAGALVIWQVLGEDNTALDPQRYVILPFAHTKGAAPTLIDGDLCARLLYQGFAQWGDVTVTEPLRVTDAMHRLRPSAASSSLTLDDALSIARGLGAGRLVRGELWQFHDTTYVTAAVYDLTHGGRQLASRAVTIVPGMSEGAVFYALADSLLYAGARSPPGSPSGRATTSRRALLAHEDGHKALDAWDLAGAAEGFRRAAAFDTGFAHAFLELAQVKAWQELPVETWRDTATRAARRSDRLAPRERILARALEAMAVDRPDEACVRYRELLQRDSLDATAWYGLAECHAKDRVVQRDDRSPSGWHFRGSYHAATLAYRRALDLAPSLNLLFRGQVYAHLAELLYTEPHHLRSGRPLPPDTGLFAAFPDFLDDTLAFIPYRAMSVFSGDAGSPRHGAEATVRTRGLLGDIVSAWVRAFPTSAEAHDGAAEWLEAQGRLGPPRGGEMTALSEIRSAQRYAADSGRLPLAVSEVRILLKLQDFRSARRLADSLLAASPDPDAAAAEALSCIALLTGRVAWAASLLQRAAGRADPATLQGRPLGAPPPVLEGVAPFIAYAAAGGPPDSVRATARRADSLIRSWIPPTRQAMARQALLLPALTLAFQSLGPSPVHLENSRNYLVDLQWRLARGDSAAVRSRLAEIRSRRRTLRGGEIAVDGVYQEALLWLALADTAAARDHLDSWLSSLAVSRRSLLWQPSQAGTFVRTMALRAELATLAGDRSTARRWAENVVALWSDADAGLQSLVTRMRRI